jgi:ribosomal-protein-alanine acetyltransferase
VSTTAAAGVDLRPAGMVHRDGILALPGLGRSTRRLLDRDLAGELPRHAVVALVAPDGGRGLGGGRGRRTRPGGDAPGTTREHGIVGFATTTRQPDEVHLLDIAVMPSWRRRGIARALVGWLAARARDEGATAMTLEVRVSNQGGLALYHRLGFTDHGVRPGYYRDGEDAVVMWHHDLSALARATGAGHAAPSVTTRTV